MSHHLMIDIETFGLRPGYAIRSIGAQIFDPNGSIGTRFYVNIARWSCEEAGLKIDPATEKWWSEQSKEAQAALECTPMNDLKGGLLDFFTWAHAEAAEFIWSHGAAFDLPIIEAAAHAVKLRAPWKYWNFRDTRTLYDIADLDVRTMNRGARVTHDARDDVSFQIACVQAAYRKLRGAEQPRATGAMFNVAWETRALAQKLLGRVEDLENRLKDLDNSG